VASFNKVFLMGNLTRDPELRYTASGAAVASFGLAVNRKLKQGEEWKDEVCFVDITVWAKQGENCAQYLNKGSLVYLEGRLNYQTWEADGGKKRSKLEVVANNVQFLGSKQSPDQEGASPPERTKKLSKIVDLPDDDLPF
jgi:single-strand DNA-binding protein